MRNLCLIDWFFLPRCFGPFLHGFLFHSRYVSCVPLRILILEYFLHRFSFRFSVFLRRLQLTLQFLDACHLRLWRIEMCSTIGTHLLVIAQTVFSSLQLKLTVLFCLSRLNPVGNNRTFPPKSVQTVQSQHFSFLPNRLFFELFF